MSGKLRLLVGLSMASFLVTVTSIIVASVIVYKRGNEASQLSNKTSTFGIIHDIKPLADAAGVPLPQTMTLNASQVALYNVPSNCWMIIANGIYDVTSFLMRHPGGSLVMTPYCGKDASMAFQTKDTKPPSTHSSTAKNLLRQYFIGDLGQSIIIPSTSGTNITPTPPSKSSLVKMGIGTLIPTVPPTAISTNTTTSTGNQSLNASVVATHNTSSDCWITISGLAYNVTTFLASHPGGVSVITIYCGKDATSAFATKDKNPSSSHSAYAIQLLRNYLVGSLGSGVASSPSSTGSTSGNSTTGTSDSGATTGTGSGASIINTPVPTVAPPPPLPTPLPASSGGYSAADVSGHNTSSNCWLIISGKVYNVTSYLTSHPGGVSVVTPYCGKDATNAFATRGGRGSNHSNFAYNLLNQYFIGNLSNGSTSPPSATFTPAPGGGNTGGATSTPVTPTSVPGGSNPTQAPTSVPSGTGNCTEGSLPSSVTSKYPDATIKKQEVGDNCSQELEVNTSSGCRHIKTNSSGAITSDSSC